MPATGVAPLLITELFIFGVGLALTVIAGRRAGKALSLLREALGADEQS